MNFLVKWFFDCFQSIRPIQVHHLGWKTMQNYKEVCSQYLKMAITSLNNRINGHPQELDKIYSWSGIPTLTMSRESWRSYFTYLTPCSSYCLFSLWHSGLWAVPWHHHIQFRAINYSLYMAGGRNTTVAWSALECGTGCTPAGILLEWEIRYYTLFLYSQTERALEIKKGCSVLWTETEWNEIYFKLLPPLKLLL